MSIAHVQWALDHGPRHQTQAFVLVALAERADASGRCFPGLAEIARRARVTPRRVRDALRELEAAGYIVTQQGRGRGRSSRYFLTMKKEDASDPFSSEKEDASDPFNNRTPATPFGEKRGRKRHEKGTLASPEPSGTVNTTSASTRARTREADGPKVVALPGGRTLDRDALVADLVDLASQASPGGIPPAGWLNPVVAVHVGRWLDLGLTHSEVRQVAEGQLARWGKPPGKPEWWDRAMRALADAKAAPPPEASTPQPRSDHPVTTRNPHARQAALDAAKAIAEARWGSSGGSDS